MDRSRDWSDVATSQGMTRAIRSRKGPGKICAPTSKSLQRENGPWPLNTLISEFRPPEL